jgi:hypothetical protein
MPTYRLKRVALAAGSIAPLLHPYCKLFVQMVRYAIAAIAILDLEPGGLIVER